MWCVVGAFSINHVCTKRLGSRAFGVFHPPVQPATLDCPATLATCLFCNTATHAPCVTQAPCTRFAFSAAAEGAVSTSTSTLPLAQHAHSRQRQQLMSTAQVCWCHALCRCAFSRQLPRSKINTVRAHSRNARRKHDPDGERFFPYPRTLRVSADARGLVRRVLTRVYSVPWCLHT